MSIISAFIGTTGGLPPKVATWGGITFDPINEGQQQTATVDFANWDSSTVYWELVEAGSGTRLDSRVVGGQAYGTISPGNGNSTQTINFTFAADATTEGTTYYVIRIGSTSGGNEYINQGNFTVRDSSQTPALVLDLDPANYSSGSPTVWPDTSGLNHTGGIYNYNTSGEAGGTFIWDGTTTQAEVPGLHNSTYGTITLSTWIKPSVVTGVTQTLIAKELCYKLRINSDGTVTMGTAQGYSPWEVTAGADAGLITAGAWANIIATVDGNYTRIYVNGVKVTETSGNIIGANGNPFDIGMYQTTGSPGDFFGGEMGEVKVWNYALSEADAIAQYNSTAARYGQSPVPLSLEFVGSGVTYLEVLDNTADWNLGSTYTIEFWSKGGNASNSTIRTVVSQYPGVGEHGWLDIGWQDAHILYNNREAFFAEPTPGAWTHVSFVSTGSGFVNLYYNGIYQTDFSSEGFIDGTGTLAVGRRGPSSDLQYFYGKLANLTISNTADRTGNFTPSTTVNYTTGTILALDGHINPLVNSSTSTHSVTNTNVLVSTDFPTVPASITITNMSVSRYAPAPATVDFTANVSASTTGTIFFAWDASTAGPYTLTINPGFNTYTSPGLGLVSSGVDLTAQISIASGVNSCTSNIYTGSWDVICLVEGTMITMADGSRKAIENIGYNDLIRVWNFDLGEFSEALPIFVKQEETHSKHYRFTFSDGTVLRTVGHHVFNKQAGEFTMLVRDTTPVGTTTFNEQGEEVTLISKETIEEPVKFYNVWTQYHLNMFADGILTSNRFNNIYPIRDMKFVKDTRTPRPLEEFVDIDPKYISGLRLQEQPKHYTAEYIKDYIENKLERLDISNTSKALS